MYVGQVEIATTETWVFDKEKKMMKKETIRYSPALLKIFDEILVNAADNRRRDPKMSVIKVSISMVGNELEISVENDGIGIPIAVHPTEQLYIPELIFGHLLTGSNFDDNEVRRIFMMVLHKLARYSRCNESTPTTSSCVVSI